MCVLVAILKSFGGAVAFIGLCLTLKWLSQHNFAVPSHHLSSTQNSSHHSELNHLVPNNRENIVGGKPMYYENWIPDSCGSLHFIRTAC